MPGNPAFFQRTSREIQLAMKLYFQQPLEQQRKGGQASGRHRAPSSCKERERVTRPCQLSDDAATHTRLGGRQEVNDNRAEPVFINKATRSLFANFSFTVSSIS